MRRYTTIVALLVCSLELMAGCAATPEPDLYGSASRSIIYESVDQLKGDTAVIVTGTVLDQETVQGESGSTFTLSVVSVHDSVLTGSAAVKPSAATSLIQSNAEVVVRQLGDSRYRDLPAPILAVGNSYLLFLTPSMLAGDAASQFYITGGSAGYYAIEDGMKSGTHALFRKVGDEGDRVPATLTLEDLK